MLLSSLTLFVPLSSRAQTIEVYDTESGSNPMSAGATAQINPASASDWPMPSLDIEFSGLPAKATVTVYITTHWLDSYDQQENHDCSQYSTTSYATCLTTPTQTVYADCNGNASATFTSSYDWGTASEVGSEGADNDDAEIQWTVNGTAESGFDFNIGGDNVPGSVYEAGLGESVDQFYQGEGAPWFWGNILDWESTQGRQYASSPGGPPLVIHNLDGIGIAQVDGHKNPSLVNDYLYWNLESNILTGLGDVLNPLQSGAYAFWDSQVQQMCQWTNGTYSGGSAGYGTCSAVQQPGTGAPPGGAQFPAGSADFYAPESLANCASNFTLPASEASGWRDAEWIKAYNGAAVYYIFWYKDTNFPNGVNGDHQFWAFNNCSGSVCNDYVPNVCSAAEY